jgi:energy-coupling factor transporter transmembrane protein EcfT
MFPIWEGTTLLGMQLIQIGEIRQKTVLDLVQEMAARQFAEVEQLKIAAASRASQPRSRRTRLRCNALNSLSR